MCWNLTDPCTVGITAEFLSTITANSVAKKVRYFLESKID